MASYSDYVTEFRDAASKTSMFEFKSGLCYVGRHAFSALPAALGHLIDTILHIDGLVTGDTKNHLDGPFGFLFGIGPFIAGAIVGMILQIALNLPAYIAYYFLDKPLSLLISGFDKIMQGQLRNMNLSLVNTIFDAINRFYVRLTQGTPTQMNGLFGFFAGVTFQTITYVLIRFGATFSSVPRFIIDKTCDGIHLLYSWIGKKVKGNKATTDDAAQAQPATPEPDQQPRLKRPPGKDPAPNQEQDNELANAMKNKLDLFAILGTTLEDYKNNKSNIGKLYKKKAPQFHPDKFPDGQPEDIKEKWDNLMAAKHILEDKNKAAVYIKWYEKNMGPGSSPAKTPATFFPKPAPSTDAPDLFSTSKLATPQQGERKRKVIGRNI